MPPHNEQKEARVIRKMLKNKKIFVFWEKQKMNAAWAKRKRRAPEEDLWGKSIDPSRNGRAFGLGVQRRKNNFGAWKTKIFVFSRRFSEGRVVWRFRFRAVQKFLFELFQKTHVLFFLIVKNLFFFFLKKNRARPTKKDPSCICTDMTRCLFVGATQNHISKPFIFNLHQTLSS